MESVNPGDYVLATRWSDESLDDPWQVGTLLEVQERRWNGGGQTLYFVKGSNYPFRHCRKVSVAEARERLSNLEQKE